MHVLKQFTAYWGDEGGDQPFRKLNKICFRRQWMLQGKMKQERGSGVWEHGNSKWVVREHLSGAN